MDRPAHPRHFVANAVAVTMAIIALTAPAAAQSMTDGYMNHDELTEAVRTIADDHADRCALDVIGESTEGRAVYLLTLAGDPATHHHRPALLVTAGLDGRHWVGTETAIRVARNLLENHAGLLDEMTVYVIPRVNPDGAELNFGAVNLGHIGTLRPVDEDRNGETGEDGPNDLLGNGVITLMRRLNPPPNDPPTHLPDPAEPRLLKRADATKGETPIYTIYAEGIDEDGDGRIAEDGPGGVDLDRNFMHLWPEHEDGAGPYQLSEPESLALAEFVVERRNIFMAITYGRHDNMINVPDHRGRDITGRTPTGIDGDDKPLYDALSELYKQTTGQERAAREDSAGSYQAWLYAHRGLVNIASTVWGRPDVADVDAEADSDNGQAHEVPGDAAADEAGDDPVSGEWAGTVDMSPMQEAGLDVPTTEEPITVTLTRHADDQVTAILDARGDQLDASGTYDRDASHVSLVAADGEMSITFELGINGNDMTGAVNAMGTALTITATRTGAAEKAASATATQSRGGTRSGGSSNDGPADAEAAGWLAYSDSLDGIGFIEWTPFDHPDLGPVEIGGFVPGFQMNPPADELDDLAEKQTSFVAELIGRRPQLTVDGPQIRRLAPNLYDVRIAIVNEGWLPTATEMGRSARVHLPVVTHLHTPPDQIIAGSRVNRATRIDGAGGRDTMHWVLRVNDGETIRIELISHQLGDRMITFTADEQSDVTISPLDPDREEVGP